MPGEGKRDNSAAIAAAIILVVVGAALYFLPKIVLWIGGYSPVLAVAVGVIVIAAFFLIFWVRSRYQKR